MYRTPRVARRHGGAVVATGRATRTGLSPPRPERWQLHQIGHDGRARAEVEGRQLEARERRLGA